VIVVGKSPARKKLDKIVSKSKRKERKKTSSQNWIFCHNSTEVIKRKKEETNRFSPDQKAEIFSD
jgi:hypothetical protein